MGMAMPLPQQYTVVCVDCGLLVSVLAELLFETMLLVRDSLPLPVVGKDGKGRFTLITDSLDKSH